MTSDVAAAVLALASLELKIALERLDPVDREIVLLRLAELSFPGIGAMVNLNYKEVERRFKRLARDLKREISA